MGRRSSAVSVLNENGRGAHRQPTESFFRGDILHSLGASLKVTIHLGRCAEELGVLTVEECRMGSVESSRKRGGFKLSSFLDLELCSKTG